MFDDVQSNLYKITEAFRAGVSDSFGASILETLLAPIAQQIGSLRAMNENVSHQVSNIAQILEEARSITPPHEID